MPREIQLSASECHINQEVMVWHLSERGHRDYGQGGNIIAVDAEHITLRTPIGNIEQFHMDDHMVIAEVPFALSDCIQYQEGVCQGNVEHFSPRGYGGPLRCEFHVDARMISYESSMERYADSDVAPSWFDSSACGERWEED